jgi:hypothetical protein
MTTFDAERPLRRATGVIVAIGSIESPLEIGRSEDGRTTPEATPFVLMVIENDGRPGVVRKLSQRAQDRSHLIAEVLATAVQLPQWIKDHHPWLDLLNHAQEPLHPYRVLELEPITRRSVEGQNVKGGIPAVPKALCDSGTDIADVFLGRAVDGRALFDSAVEKRLAQSHGGAQVEGQQTLAGLLASMEEAERFSREDALHDVLNFGKFERE